MAAAETKFQQKRTRHHDDGNDYIPNSWKRAKSELQVIKEVATNESKTPAQTSSLPDYIPLLSPPVGIEEDVIIHSTLGDVCRFVHQLMENNASELQDSSSSSPQPVRKNKKKLWVIWDLDETLVTSARGSHPLLTYRGIDYLETVVVQRDEFKHVSPMVLSTARSMLLERMISTDLIYSDTVGMIKRLQNLHPDVHVFALTARNKSARMHTQLELKRHGIEFAHSHPFPFGRWRGADEILFEDGVLYTTGTCKSEALHDIILASFKASSDFATVYDSKEASPHLIFSDDMPVNISDVYRDRSLRKFFNRITCFHFDPPLRRHPSFLSQLSIAFHRQLHRTVHNTCLSNLLNQTDCDLYLHSFFFLNYFQLLSTHALLEWIRGSAQSLLSINNAATTEILPILVPEPKSENEVPLPLATAG